MSEVEILYIHRCFCGHSGGRVIKIPDLRPDLANVLCSACNANVLATAFVKVGTKVRIGCPHNCEHKIYQVKALSGKYPDDYHAQAQCLSCDTYWTIGPNDTNPPWYNWAAHEGWYMKIPEEEKKMNAGLTFDKFQKAIIERNKTSFPQCNDWTASDWMTALAGEVGEAANLIKKRRRGMPVSDEAITHELADVISYVAILADFFGANLGNIVAEKFNIVSKRVHSPTRLTNSED